MSITTSWLVLAIIAVRLAFKKAPKWILCLLWGLVAVRLICPFSIKSGLSLIPKTEPFGQNISQSSNPVKPARGEILDSQGNVIVEQRPAAWGDILDSDGNIILERNDGITTYPEKARPLSWSYYLSRIWVAGFAVMLAYTVVSYVMLKRKVSTAVPFKRGIKQSEYVDSPFVLGIVRPVIYLPFGMASEDMIYVIAHEKAHIRRRDHWWKPLGFLLLSVYWFNPVLWVAYILLCRDIEAACDEKVIRNMEKDQRRAYSTALLHCSIHRRRIAACPLAFGEVGVKERIKSVMNYRKPAFWVILIALVVSIVVAVCFLTDPKKDAPITMRADFVSRTWADLKFVYEDGLAGKDFQISEGYVLEAWEESDWYQVENLSGTQATEPVYEVQSEDADFDAWSLPNWEENFGRLPDGYFRIKKEITINNGTEDPETYPVYVEFTIGGTADDYVIFTLEDVTPTGANLYEQEQADVHLIYDDGAGIWMEVYRDDRWQYLEPTQYIEPILQKDRHYIPQFIYPSSHTGLDWSGLYGELPDGTYRIAREITNVEENDLHVCTAYAEFTIGGVYTWFDWYSDDLEERHPKSTQNDLPGVDGVSLVYDTSAEEIRMITEEDEITVFSSEPRIRSVLLTDLNGDGVSEICANLNTEAGILAQVYDPVERKQYELSVGDDWYYILTEKADRLCALKYDWNSNITGYGQVFLSSDGLEIREVDETLTALTDNVVCVDIWTRKHVSLSSGEEFHRFLTLLHGLENQVQPAEKEELEAAQKDNFDHSFITVQYALGEKTLAFSEDFEIVWENGAEGGFRVLDPEPLRQFVESVTNGVVNHPVSGEPFASVDSPWDWCAGIRTNAVESARTHVCLNTYSYGNSSGSSSTSGWISQATLQELIQILNRIPKDAFVMDKTVSKETYRRLFSNQQEGNGSVSVIDGVNNMAVLIKYRNGKVTMLLTDEIEKAKDDFSSYLEPTQLWEVKEETLETFMESLVANPPVIDYSVGAEYEWQDPVEFKVDGFSLELRLPEGWEYVHINNPSDTGIRCRPEGIADGWIYFSYKPEGYSPMEEDRYYGEGSIWGYPTVTSYPSSVKSKLGIDTRHAVWSFQRVELDRGSYVIINDGADEWFLEYEGQIEDIITLSDFSVTE